MGYRSGLASSFYRLQRPPHRCTSPRSLCSSSAVSSQFFAAASSPTTKQRKQQGWISI